MITDILIKKEKFEVETGKMVNEFKPVSEESKYYFRKKYGMAFVSFNIESSWTDTKAIELHHLGFNVKYE